MANYKYPAEYRAHAVELWRTSGKSQRAVSLELGISNELLRRWVRQDDLDEGLRSDGPTTTEREELRLLRAEVKTLRMERDFLKKARPSSPGRSTGHAEGVQVDRGREGQLPRNADVPPPRRVQDRLLRLAFTAPQRPGLKLARVDGQSDGQDDTLVHEVDDRLATYPASRSRRPLGRVAARHRSVRGRMIATEPERRSVALAAGSTSRIGR